MLHTRIESGSSVPNPKPEASRGYNMPVLFQFLKNEDGAVTVDWVVLTGSLVGLAILVVTSVATGMNDVSTGVGAQLSAGQPAAVDFSAINNPGG